MTDTLDKALRDLASSVPVVPVDVRAVSRLAARRRTRGLAAMSGAAGAAAAIALAASAVGLGTNSPADNGPFAAASSAPQPSEARLREVAAGSTPPIIISALTLFPAGPVPPPTTDAAQPGARAWGAPGRSQSREVTNGPAGDATTVAWTVVTPALSDDEGDQLARGGPPDPAPRPMPGAERIGRDSDNGVHWSAWSSGGGLSVAVWADNGGLAWLSEPAVRDARADAERLIAAGKALLNGRPAQGATPNDASARILEGARA